MIRPSRARAAMPPTECCGDEIRALRGFCWVETRISKPAVQLLYDFAPSCQGFAPHRCRTAQAGPSGAPLAIAPARISGVRIPPPPIMITLRMNASTPARAPRWGSPQCRQASVEHAPQCSPRAASATPL
jgi:hypothetical protein